MIRKAKGDNGEKGPLEPEITEPRGSSMRRTARNILRGAAAAIVGGFMFYNTCTTYVKPNEFGIKQVDISPAGMLGKQGIHKEVYNSGLHIVWPMLEKIHRFPKDVQVLHLHKGEGSSQADRNDETLVEKEKRYATSVDPANIQTSDGFYITLNVDLLYRIKDPYQVITTLGAGRLFESNGIMPKTEPALKEALGILNPEDFYNSKLRVEKQEVARNLLDSILDSKGLKMYHVLVRYPEYHPDVQARIEGRKLQDQLVYTNQAKARERAAQADLQKMIQEGIATKNVRIEEAEAYITRKTAEKDLYNRVKRAEADKLIKLANAEKTQMINDAYQGQGSERLVGLKMAEVMKGLDSIVITTGGNQGFNPLDLESMLKSWNIYETEGGKSK